jgi:hypothetical protein
MSGKSDKGAKKTHKDKDLEKWAEEDKDSQHPGEFLGPLHEVDSTADAEAAKRRKTEYERRRAEEKKMERDKNRQHPGDFLGPLHEVDVESDDDP